MDGDIEHSRYDLEALLQVLATVNPATALGLNRCMLFLERRLWMVCVTGLLTLGPHVSMAQTLESGSAPPISVRDKREIDEIVVAGKKTLRTIRQEIRNLDLRIYSMFNELNKDDNYDIICRKMARIGSQIVRNNCKAKLYWDSLSEFAEETDGGVFTPQRLSNRQKHIAIFRAKLADLADENATLHQALVQRKLLADEERAKLGDQGD